MSEVSNPGIDSPNRRLWIRDIQVLIALIVLAVSLASGWTTLNSKVTNNEADLAAQAKRMEQGLIALNQRLDREIVVQYERSERLENYLIRIENKLDGMKNINREGQGSPTSLNLSIPDNR